MRRFFIATFLFIFFSTQVFATVSFVEFLPNPVGDDALYEYIEIRNTGCDAINISGYTISDASGKTYTIPSASLLSSRESRRYFASETKIALNNSGQESVFLRDAGGNIIDSYTYSGTQKEGVVITLSLSDNDCPVSPPPQNDTATGGVAPVQTGSTSSTGSVSLDPPSNSSTGILLTQTGTMDASTGVTVDTGSLMSSTGGMSTFDTGSGMTQTGTSSSSGGLMTSSGSSVVVSSGSILQGDTASGVGLSGSVYSGSSLSTNPSIPTESGSLTPIDLLYDDRDVDGKIDTLEIVYPFALTGIVNTGAILLYSNTGGLYQNRVNTETGYILEGSLSGNILILTILESEIEKTNLKVNNTTSSELRLKSGGNLGFQSLSGKIPTDFLLTSSFESYKNVRNKNQTLSIVSSSGTMISSGTTTIVQTFFFPDIRPTLQSPSNVTASGDVLLCTSADCRINITLEPIFSSGYLMKDYICAFGTGGELITDTDCNPNTYYYTSTGALEIELREKTNPLNQIRKIYPVFWQVPPSHQTSQVTTLIPIVKTPDTGKPIPIIEIDTKWKESYYQNGEYGLICYTFTCSVNLTAERSYDPEGSKVQFLWIFGPNDISTSKDPGTRKYGLGKHTITLRAIDEAGNYGEILYAIEVVGPKPKEEKPKIEKTVKKIENKKTLLASITEESSSEKKPKKPKKLKMQFYTSPTITLQGKTGKAQGLRHYLCEYKKKPLCSINFTLDTTISGYTYVWKSETEILHTGKNPKSWKLPPGTHRFSLTVYRKGETIAFEEQIFTVEVRKAPKKPKKSSTSKKSPSSSTLSSMTSIPETQASSPQTDSTSYGQKQYGGIIFLFSIIFFYFLRRKIGIPKNPGDV